MLMITLSKVSSPPTVFLLNIHFFNVFLFSLLWLSSGVVWTTCDEVPLPLLFSFQPHTHTLSLSLHSRFLSSESLRHTQTLPNNTAAANLLLPHHCFILQVHNNSPCKYLGIGHHICYQTARSPPHKAHPDPAQTFPQADLFIFSWQAASGGWVCLCPTDQSD